MFAHTLYLSIMAIAMAIFSVFVLIGFGLRMPEVNRHVRDLAVLGWSFSAVGWSLFAAYLMAPIWFRLLVK